MSATGRWSARCTDAAAALPVRRAAPTVGGQESVAAGSAVVGQGQGEVVIPYWTLMYICVQDLMGIC